MRKRNMPMNCLEKLKLESHEYCSTINYGI